MDITYFHEDDYKQIEFSPRENMTFLMQENAEINSLIEEETSQYGFDNLYVRQEHQQISLLEKQIAITAMDLFLINLGLTKIEEVYSGYGSLVEKCADMLAYKPSAGCIFITINNQWVEDFFLTDFRGHKNPAIKNQLVDILYKIGIEYAVVLNDWNLAELIDIQDKIAIEEYLYQ